MRIRAKAVQEGPECHAENRFIYPTNDKDPSQISRQQHSMICFTEAAQHTLICSFICSLPQGREHDMT